MVEGKIEYFLKDRKEAKIAKKKEERDFFFFP
jgi:hypothetical protein